MVSVFIANEGAFAPAVYPRVVVSPRDTRWNDFGYNFHASVEILLSQHAAPLDLRALVVPIESFDGTELKLHSNFDGWLQQALLQASKRCLSVDEDLRSSDRHPAFVLLLQGADSYKELAQHVSDQATRLDLLSKLCELLTLRQSQRYTGLFNKLLASKKFALGVMRTGSAYRALHRGGRFIWGNFAATQREDARVPMSFSCHLKGFTDAPHQLVIEFLDSDIIEDRIHCLVGKNGCGKTRVMHELVLRLGADATADEQGTPFLDHESSSAHSAPSYEGEAYERVICFSFDAQSRFPTGVRNDSRFEYIFANLNVLEKPVVAEPGAGAIEDQQPLISQGLSSASGETTTRLLVDILRNEDPIGPDRQYRWDLFRQALEGYVDLSRLELPLLRDEAAGGTGREWYSAEMLRHRGEQASLELYSRIDHDEEPRFAEEGEEAPLSSGERMFFRFALNLLSYADDGSLLIIDEPETHLHPNLVCDFMNVLYMVLSATKSVALIATHSAYVIREVPTHCAHIYSIDEDKRPRSASPGMRTLGANIESISQAIFADSNAEKFHTKIAERMAAEGLTLDDLIAKYGGLISPDLFSQVARMLHAPTRSGGDHAQ